MECFLAYGFICGNILILEFDNISVPGTELYVMLLQLSCYFLSGFHISFLSAIFHA